MRLLSGVVYEGVTQQTPIVYYKQTFFTANNLQENNFTEDKVISVKSSFLNSGRHKTQNFCQSNKRSITIVGHLLCHARAYNETTQTQKGLCQCDEFCHLLFGDIIGQTWSSIRVLCLWDGYINITIFELSFRIVVLKRGPFSSVEVLDGCTVLHAKDPILHKEVPGTKDAFYYRCFPL